ncbi:hypothetical protein LB503_009070 [Fusarium chuoi]|nr:hypothetical protein LB503_009070 [Fusarium chuoi]
MEPTLRKAASSICGQCSATVRRQLTSGAAARPWMRISAHHIRRHSTTKDQRRASPTPKNRDFSTSSVTKSEATATMTNKSSPRQYQSSGNELPLCDSMPTALTPTTSKQSFLPWPRNPRTPRLRKEPSRLSTSTLSAQTVAYQFIAARSIGWMITKSIWKFATLLDKLTKMTTICARAEYSKKATSQIFRWNMRLST